MNDLITEMEREALSVGSNGVGKRVLLKGVSRLSTR